VAAVQAYSKINATGQWVDRSEHVYLNELFERMTQQELEAYARDGSLPTWFTDTVSMTETGSKPKTGYPADSVYHRPSASVEPAQKVVEPDGVVRCVLKDRTEIHRAPPTPPTYVSDEVIGVLEGH
jgi:hypothetical protein